MRIFRKSTIAALVAALSSFAICGTQDVTIAVNNLADVLVEHAGYSPLTINATYDTLDVSGGGTLVVRDTDGNVIVSTNATATASNVLQAVTVAGNWATNLTEITRYYGDMRVNGYGNPLPWLAIDVRPGYNTGEEGYVPPSVGEWQTNGVTVGDSDTIKKVNLTTNVSGVLTGDTLEISVVGSPDPNAIYKDGSRAWEADQSMGGYELTNAAAMRSTIVQVTGGTGTFGEFTYNDAEKTLDVDLGTTSGQMFQEVHWPVKNGTASQIDDGTLVYIESTDGNSGNIVCAEFIADGSILAGYMLGVTTEDIAAGAEGKVTVHGKVRGLDTSGYDEGAVLYASWLTAGAFETNPPAQGVGQYIPVGIVINSHDSVGTIAVRVTAIDLNLWEFYGNSLLIDGTRAMTGNLDMGTNSIENVKTLTAARGDGGVFDSVIKATDSSPVLGIAVEGVATGGTGYGIYGVASGEASTGVGGIANGTNSVAVRGVASGTGSLAGDFTGDVNVTGEIAVTVDASNGTQVVNYQTMTNYVASQGSAAGGYQQRAITTDFIPTDTNFVILATNNWDYAMPDAGASIASPETFVQKKWRLSPSETNLYINGSMYADASGASYTNLFAANGTTITNVLSNISTNYASPTTYSINIPVDPNDIWVTFDRSYAGGSVATDYYDEFEVGTNK